MPRLGLVAEAIFGLVGVGVGGLVTGGVQLILDWRREQRDLRRTKRLVGAELREGAYLYAALSHLKEWPEAGSAADYILSTAEWNEHRSYLALALDDELWDALADTYTLIRSDRGTILQSLEQNAGKPMPREKREEFRRDFDRLRAIQARREGRPQAPERPITGPRREPSRPYLCLQKRLQSAIRSTSQPLSSLHSS
jgi:hypothetical protein